MAKRVTLAWSVKYTYRKVVKEYFVLKQEPLSAPVSVKIGFGSWICAPLRNRFILERYGTVTCEHGLKNRSHSNDTKEVTVLYMTLNGRFIRRKIHNWYLAMALGRKNSRLDEGITWVTFWLRTFFLRTALWLLFDSRCSYFFVVFRSMFFSSLGAQGGP